MTRHEQETIIRFDAEKAQVNIFTAYAPARARIERRGYAPHRISHLNGREVGWFYRLPYAEFKWRVTGAGRATRALSDDQRQTLAARGRSLAGIRPGANRSRNSSNFSASVGANGKIPPDPEQVRAGRPVP